LVFAFAEATWIPAFAGTTSTEILLNSVISPDNTLAELDRLAELAEDVIRRARAAGASQAAVSASVDTGLSVTTRLGEVETVERNRDRGFGLTVYFGQRKGNASTADLKPASIDATIEQACAIARYTEPDPYAGLADAERMATRFPDLDLWHPWDLDVDRAIEIGREVEAAGRADSRIANSEGATVQRGEGIGVYANSHGFVGRERGTHHSVSCSLIAGKGDAMQRDGWYEYVRNPTLFPEFARIGTTAAERATARLGARKLSTRNCPVLFAPDVARSLLGHLIAAVSGGSLYRRSSFLLDHAGKAVLPGFVDVLEQPLLPGGHASTAFDAEGVATGPSALVESGVLQRYVLGSYSARKLGLTTTANAGGVHNLVVPPGSVDGGQPEFGGLLQRMGSGLVVTELIGQGVSIVTGDYSRGAAGFWVENGEIAFPVQEVTIAGNLRDMFMDMQAIGTDVDPRSSILTGSILVGKMTVAGD
jgi:PmbA protein